MGCECSPTERSVSVVNRRPPFEPNHKRLFALFTLEALIADDLALPEPLRRKMEVPSKELEAALEALDHREVVALMLAIEAWEEPGRWAGLCTRTELASFLARFLRGAEEY